MSTVPFGRGARGVTERRDTRYMEEPDFSDDFCSFSYIWNKRMMNSKVPRRS